MSIESRIEADLSGQNTSSQSRIEQILNGEQITPRSRIEQLLQEYNPEDPGSYHKVECTKAQYDSMQSHSSNTIYVVTYPDQSVHFYLGDDEIAGNPTLIEKTITTNGTYHAISEGVDGYSAVTVNVPNTEIRLPLEQGGLNGAAEVGLILSPKNTADVYNIRVRGMAPVFLDAGTYTISTSPTAGDNLQFNTALHGLTTYSANDYYVFATTRVGRWEESISTTIVMTEPGYLSLIVRKRDNSEITPAVAGTYVTIRKI